MSSISQTSEDNEQTVAAAAVLARWYVSHSTVRRLWALEQSGSIRIILALEPTVDGSDTHPAWLANSTLWRRELEDRMHKTIQLELFDELAHVGFDFSRDGRLITDQAWRDSAISAD